MAKWTNNIDLANSIEYNTNNKWVKENNLVTVREYEDFYSKVMSINTGTHFEKTHNDLYIIPTGDEFGVNNTLIFTDGNSVNPSIEKIVHIFLDDETDIKKVRDYIYGKEISKWKISRGDVTKIYGENVFREYNKPNSGYIYWYDTNREGNSRTENKPDNRQLHNRTGNTGESEITLKCCIPNL